MAAWVRLRAQHLDTLPARPKDDGGVQRQLVRSLARLTYDPSPLPLEPNDLPLLP